MFVGVLLFVFTALLYFFLQKKFSYWKTRDVPFPEPLLLGNTGSALFTQRTMADLLNKIYRDYPGYSYVGLFNLWRPAVLIRDPELAKDVLVKQFGSFHNNWIEADKEVDPVKAYNPFVLQNEEWKAVRTQLTPQLTRSKVKSFFPLLQKTCNIMVEYIKAKNEASVAVKDLCARFTSDNVFGCVYGLECNGFLEEFPETFKIIGQLTSISRSVQLKQSIALFLPTLRRILKTTYIGDPTPKVFWDMILTTMKYREENDVERNDLMNFLVELKKKDSSKENVDMLVAHAFTFFSDGVETSALVFAYALFELSQRPDVQQKARGAIEKVMEKHKGLTYEALQEITFIDNIVFETLRKRPMIRFLGRTCTKDYAFPHPKGPHAGKDVLIERGTHVFIPVEAIHHDEHVYPNPDDFDPARFDEEKSSRPKCTFLGFGDGPRICLGRQFALEQIKLGLVAVLRNFDLKLSSRTQLPLVNENVHIFNAVIIKSSFRGGHEIPAVDETPPERCVLLSNWELFEVMNAAIVVVVSHLPLIFHGLLCKIF